MTSKIMTADEIYEKTMRTVAPLPCQESYARELAAIFAFHIKKNALMDAGFSADSLPYQGAVVVAPTGTGKTFLLKAAAKILKVNTIIIDCGSLCKDGWKGPSFSQQLMAAKNAAEDRESFERSILFLDEIDKIKLYHGQHDEGNPMDNLLQLYNGGKIAAESGSREVEYIDVSRFTIVLGGAFAGLEDIIRSRIAPKSTIGFGRASQSESIDMKGIMHKATPEDLEKYGMKKELVARIASIISIDPMQLEDYHCLLTAKEGSVKARYNNFFSFGSGVKFDISKNAVTYIADLCSKSTTGARAVNPIINDIMREAIAMVDRDKAINSIILDAGDNGCFLRYEYGAREYSALEDNDLPRTPYYLSAKTLSSMVTKLCNLYKKSECDPDYADEFKCFVHLTLVYLRYNTNPSDFCYESLQKLARATGKPNSSCSSPYDIIMTDAIKIPTHHADIDVYYEKFRNMWNQDTMYRLNKALTIIVGNVKREHHSSNIKFRLEYYN